MSDEAARALLLLSRWRRIIDSVSTVTTLDPTDPEIAAIYSELVELSDETDRFIDGATDGHEALS